MRVGDANTKECKEAYYQKQGLHQHGNRVEPIINLQGFHRNKLKQARPLSRINLIMQEKTDVYLEKHVMMFSNSVLLCQHSHISANSIQVRILYLHTSSNINTAKQSNTSSEFLTVPYHQYLNFFYSSVQGMTTMTGGH